MAEEAHPQPAEHALRNDGREILGQKPHHLHGCGGTQVQGRDPEQALGPAQRQVLIHDLLHQERWSQLQHRAQEHRDAHQGEPPAPGLEYGPQLAQGHPLCCWVAGEVLVCSSGVPFVTLPCAGQTLGPVDAGVQPVACAELGVGPLLENAAMVQHHHQIGLGKCRQSVREQHDRALLCVRLRRAEELSQASDDLGFRVQVQGRERIVQDQQPWSLRAGAAIARASAMRWRWPPETRMPSSPISVSRPAGKVRRSSPRAAQDTAHSRTWTVRPIGGVVLSLPQGYRAQQDVARTVPEKR